MNETLDFNATDNIVPENEPSTTPEPAAAAYKEEDIRTLDWREHIRLRPGMYIGKLGDGSYNDDGIYVLLKEVLDNAIDEYMMGFGRQSDVLRPRNPTRQTHRCGIENEHRGEIRFQGI